MAQTHTLSADTLVSLLTLADGDTIELAGYNIIWDADTRATGVTIANSGAAGHFECRNGGGVKLNASLPSNVSPWVDPENPLPESNYAAGLTANASFEFQLAGNFSLGGGAASLPTETRAGGFWAISASSSDDTHLTFDRDIPLHPGDIIYCCERNDSGAMLTISAYDSTTYTATTVESISSTFRTANYLWALAAGGIVIVSQSAIALSQPIYGGTINIISENAYSATTSNVVAARFSHASRFSSDIYPFYGNNTCAIVCELAERGTLSVPQNATFIEIGECVCQSFFGYTGDNNNDAKRYGSLVVGGGSNSAWTAWTDNYLTGDLQCVFENFSWRVTYPRPSSPFVSARLKNCTINGTPTGDMYFEQSGTVTRAETIRDAWFHAPATSTGVTWRYEDRTVKPHATIRIRSLWKRGENSSATASAAITDCANWYPGTQVGALAETIFPASQNDGWQEARIEWRNTSEVSVQVRVWECVTGDVQGGYLCTMEATGGPM